MYIIYNNIYIISLLAISDKEKSLKRSQKIGTHHIQGNKNKDENSFLIRDIARLKLLELEMHEGTIGYLA